MSESKSNSSGGRVALTVKRLEAMKPGETVADPASRGAGSLEARRLKGGALIFYYRYTASNGVRERIPLGSELTLAEARKKSQELSRRYQGGDRDLRAVLEAEQQEQGRQREAVKRAAEAAAARRVGTLGCLLEGYVAHLRASGKVSWREVELCVVRHVKGPWPALWGTPAADITAADVLGIVSRLVHAGHRREAAKLRSNIRAAYTAGIRACQDAGGLPALRALGLSHNPVRDTVPVADASAPGERALSLAEIRAYWQRIEAMPGARGALLRFHVLTGCQRIKQLGRAKTADLDMDVPAVRLFDPKGRRSKPRAHWVPLVPEAIEALHVMGGGAMGPYLFTVTGGAGGAHNTNVGKYVAEVARAMLEAGELPGGLFTAGDLRRTVETRLAGANVSREVRAHLQSHGLSGVQYQHYDRHDYLAEKRAALGTLLSMLKGDVVPNVVAFGMRQVA